MNTSPEIIAAIRARVTDWGTPESPLSNSDIVAALNAVMVANPAPAPLVKPILSKSYAFGLLTEPASKLALLEFPNLALVYQSFDLQDHESCVTWVAALCAVGKITESERDTVIAYITTEVPEPSWPELVPEPLTYTGGRTLDTDDIQAAREAETDSDVEEEA